MSTLHVAPQTAPDAADVDTVEGVVRDSHSAPLPAFFGLHASDVWDGELTAILNNLVRGVPSGALVVSLDEIAV